MSDSSIDEPGQSLTLVKYNNPVLVIKYSEKKPAKDLAKEKRRPRTAGALLDNKKETEEVLNFVLPPRCWEENGQMWTQTVSTTPATRQDVINLQEMLDSRLQQSQARETGICPIRRELYMQCFDELIRQVTINCAERGLLLLRIRDEITMTMEAYETLYCSSIAFGLRKALQAHEEKEQLRTAVDTLQKEKDSLEDRINDIKEKNEQTERRTTELRLAEERKFNEEIAFLKKTNAQLKMQLEGILAPKK